MTYNIRRTGIKPIYTRMFSKIFPSLRKYLFNSLQYNTVESEIYDTKCMKTKDFLEHTNRCDYKQILFCKKQRFSVWKKNLFTK